MKLLYSFAESCNCRLNIIFSVEVSLKTLVPNERNYAEVEFREKQGKSLLVRISLVKVLPDLQLFSVRMTSCIYRST